MSTLLPPPAANLPGATVIIIDVTRLPSALWPPPPQADTAVADKHEDSALNDLDAMATNVDDFTDRMVEDKVQQAVRQKWEAAAEVSTHRRGAINVG